jgi:hypothetical protein
MTIAKPVLDPKVLRAAVAVAIPILIGMLEVLELYHGKVTLTDPAFWVKMIQVVGAGLFGKEVLKRQGDYSADELPRDWIERQSGGA